MGNSLGRRIAGGFEKFFRGVVSGLAAGGIGAAIGSLFGPVGLAVGAITGVISSAALSTRNIVHYINSDEEPTTTQLLMNFAGDIKDTAMVFGGSMAGPVVGLVKDLGSGMSIRGAQLKNGISHVPRAIQDGGIRGLANRSLIGGVNAFTALAIGNSAFRTALAAHGRSSYHAPGIEQHIYGSAMAMMSQQAMAAAGGGSAAASSQSPGAIGSSTGPVGTGANAPSYSF